MSENVSERVSTTECALYKGNNFIQTFFEFFKIFFVQKDFMFFV